MSAINDKFAIVPIEAFFDTELTPAEFRMLAVLYSFRDKNANTVWPNLSSIRDRAGYSDTTQVSRMTTKLERKGWLTKAKKRGSHGPKIYELIVPERIQIGRNSQVDSVRQVDIPEHEEAVPNSQVDSLGQVDNSAQKTDANLTDTVMCQLDRDGQGYIEQTIKNIPINQQSSESVGTDSAPHVANPVDNSLAELAQDYQSPTAEQMIFQRGTQFLTTDPSITEERARKCLGHWKATHGVNRTLDAVVTTIIAAPQGDPIAHIEAVFKRQPQLIDPQWEPTEEQTADLSAELTHRQAPKPIPLIKASRDTFVTWFRGMEIGHSDWPRLFRDWVLRDWERAQRNHVEYLRRLAAVVGSTPAKPFEEPA